MFGQASGQDALGLGLRGDDGVGVGTVDDVQFDAGQDTSRRVHLDAGGLDAGFDDVVEHADPFEHFEAARVDDDGA